MKKVNIIKKNLKSTSTNKDLKDLPTALSYLVPLYKLIREEEEKEYKVIEFHEACRILEKASNTLYGWEKKEYLKSIKRGGTRYYWASDIDKLKEELKSNGRLYRPKENLNFSIQISLRG